MDLFKPMVRICNLFYKIQLRRIYLTQAGEPAGTFLTRLAATLGAPSHRGKRAMSC